MSSAAIPITATVGGLGLLKIIISTVRGTYGIKEPPPPTDCFGNYCIKAETKLMRKNKEKPYKIYKGYDKNANISKKVEHICNEQKSNKKDITLYCTRPEITFNRHLQMCNGQIEIHYPDSKTITIIK